MSVVQSLIYSNPTFDTFVSNENNIQISIIFVTYVILGATIYICAYLLLHYLIKVTNRVKELEKKIDHLENNIEDNMVKKINMVQKNITNITQNIIDETIMNVKSITKNMELLHEIVDKNKNSIKELEEKTSMISYATIEINGYKINLFINDEMFIEILENKIGLTNILFNLNSLKYFKNIKTLEIEKLIKTFPRIMDKDNKTFGTFYTSVKEDVKKRLKSEITKIRPDLKLC